MKDIERHTRTVIVAYGRNDDDTLINKEKIWNELTLVVGNCKCAVLVAGDIGDLNTRVGSKQGGVADVIGKFGEQIINDNGKR